MVKVFETVAFGAVQSIAATQLDEADHRKPFHVFSGSRQPDQAATELSQLSAWGKVDQSKQPTTVDGAGTHLQHLKKQTVMPTLGFFIGHGDTRMIILPHKKIQCGPWSHRSADSLCWLLLQENCLAVARGERNQRSEGLRARVHQVVFNLGGDADGHSGL